MAHPPLRLLPKGTERVLLVDCFQPTRDARAKVLRARGIDVGTAETLDEARVFFQPGHYDLVMLNLRRYPADAALMFCRIINDIDPDQRIVLLLGPPNYLALDWKMELAPADELSRHVQAMAKQHAAAA